MRTSDVFPEGMDSGLTTTRNNAEQLFSEVVSFVRFPLAVLVVAIHWNAYMQLGGYLPAQTEGAVPPAVDLWRILTGCAVPAFFAISGYLFFRASENAPGFTRAVYGSKLKRRIYTLLIPFLVWNIIALLAKSVSFPEASDGNPTIFASNLWGYICGQNWHIFWDCKCLNGTEYPMLVPLWYIRDLMVVVLLSPVFYVLLRRGRSRAWAVTRCVLFFTAIVLAGGCGWWPFAHGASLTAVFWFGAGAALALQRGEGVVARTTMAGPLLLAGGVASLYFLQACPGGLAWCYVRYLARAVCVLGVLASAGLIIQRTSWRFARDFSAATMFIYCWHNVFLIGSEYIVSRAMEKAGAFAWCHAQSPAAVLYMVLPPVLEAVMGVYVHKLLVEYLPRPARTVIGLK